MDVYLYVRGLLKRRIAFNLVTFGNKNGGFEYLRFPKVLLIWRVHEHENFTVIIKQNEINSFLIFELNKIK